MIANNYPRMARQPGSLASAVTLVAALAGLQGCATGIHLYDEQNHKAAQEASTNLSEAGLSKALVGQRERVAEITQRELEVVRRQGQARRDAKLLIPIHGRTRAESWGWLEQDVNKRVEVLAGMGQKDVRALLIEVQGKKNELDTALETYMLVPGAGSPPPCPLGNTQPPTDPALAVVFDFYKTACAEYTAKRDVLASQSGDIGKLTLRIKEVEGERAELTAKIGDLDTDYKAALKAYEEAVKKGDPAEIDKGLEKVKEAIAKFGAAAQTAGLALGPLGFDSLKLEASIAGLEKQRELMAQGIQSIAKAEEAGSEEAPAAEDAATGSAEGAADGAVAVTDPSGADGGDAAGAGTEAEAEPALTPEQQIALTVGVVAGHLIQAESHPQLGALLLKKEHLRIEIDGQKKRLNNANTRFRLMQQKLASMGVELASLKKIQVITRASRSGNTKGVLPPGCTSVALIKKFESTPGCREGIGQVLMMYGNSYSVGRIVQDEIDYKLIALRHDAVLDNSETALAQWENLLTVPASQLVGYYGSGIKPEEIARFLHAFGNAAGLVFIGTQVN